MTGLLRARVLKKAWNINMKVPQKNESENDATLNREPAKKFQKWGRMGKSRRQRDNPS